MYRLIERSPSASGFTDTYSNRSPASLTTWTSRRFRLRSNPACTILLLRASLWVVVDGNELATRREALLHDSRNDKMVGVSLGFTSAGRDILGDDHIELTSVGVDIGSSTSHLVFSHLELERDDQRYVMTKRAVLRESDILLTPYLSPTEIDGGRLESFVEAEYQAAGIKREEVDSGAVILTGTALMRENSRMIADLFAAEAGKFVAVSAGDRLEASLAAHGSGAAAASAGQEQPVLNVDIGGGTTKFALCQDGAVLDVAAI